MTEPAKPGILDRYRARYKWFDHVMRAQERYQDSKGDFYAAGITYFTIFALFPLLMVAFSIAGFVLASQPDLLAEITDKIKSTVSGDLGDQLVQLMDSAIKSRTSVGIIGLATAAWAGLGWMANLREALSQMWGLLRQDTAGFVRTKLSDLLAILGLFSAIILTVALSALGNSGLMKQVVEWLGLQDFPGMSIVLRMASIAVSHSGLVAAVHLDDRPAASRVGDLPQRCAGRADGRGCLRDLQAGGVVLSQVRDHRPRRRDVRPRARPDGVRLHHRADDSVRDGVGGDRQGEPGSSADRTACGRGDQPAGPGARGAGARRRAHRNSRGSTWRPWPFPVHPTSLIRIYWCCGRRFSERAPMIRQNTMIAPTNATPTRTGSASAAGNAGAAVSGAPVAASSGVVTSDGSGSISVPTFVPGAVAKP